jgi:hypothetical protein
VSEYAEWTSTVNRSVAALLAEVEALRRRLDALEARVADEAREQRDRHELLDGQVDAVSGGFLKLLRGLRQLGAL